MYIIKIPPRLSYILIVLANIYFDFLNEFLQKYLKFEKVNHQTIIFLSHSKKCYNLSYQV